MAHWSVSMNSSNNLALVFLLIILIHSSISVANSEDELLSFYGDEEFVSIATGISQPLSKAPAVASVVTAEHIKRIGATDLEEVLETIPGLHVASNAAGYGSIYVFRGVYSGFNPQVLMLINGVPVTNLFVGDRGQAWAGMSVEAISRIEIIRGPGSAVYGADAFAGVINIVTKNSREISGLNAGIRYGSFDTKDVWINYGHSGEKIDFSATVEFHDTDNQDEKIVADSQTFLDAISGTSASLTPGEVNLQRENVDARLELGYGNFTFRSGAQIRRDAGLGVGLAQALDSNGQVSSQRYNTDLTYDNPDYSENIGIKISVSYLDTSQEVEDDLLLFPAGSRGPFLGPMGAPIFPPFPNGIIGNPEIYERHTRVNLIGTYRYFEKHEFTAGSGYYYGEVYKTEEEKNFGIDPATGFPILPGSGLIDVSDTPLVFLPEDNRENRYIFIQDVWHLANDWELTAGVRYDHYSDFGDTVNPRLALVWSTRHNLTSKLLYGEAFRAPSFAETRVQSNPVALGNPDLEPETLKSYEIAFNYRPTFDLSIDLNLFHYEWKDIIHFVQDTGNATRTAQNVGEQEADGLEIEVNWNITEQLSILTNYSWQDSEDQNTGSNAANAPEQQFYIRGFAQLPNDFDVTVQLNNVMDRNRAFGDSRSDIDDYTIVDMTIRKKFYGEQLELSVLAKNIFDEDAREPSLNTFPVPAIQDDLPLAGRR
ncbi:MAG: TonB-dependent receptor, partial [Flavobacteriales bacterium]|nr:TonB-dependent receptor [Flavobacteriales bacterium]